MDRRDKLLKERGKLTRKMLRFREMLPGSFTERLITCGKKTCICNTEGKKHAAFQISYRMQNKSFTKMIPRHKADEVHKRIRLQKKFNQIVKRIQEINIELLISDLKERKPTA